MTINKLISKLRKNNIHNYYLLLFCTVLSVMLITSFALMYFSPTVQQCLPTGGDSRKQALMVFTVAIVGCAVFSTYASSLFFKYKSREFGIFMALGEKKRTLKKLLFRELCTIISLACSIGLILSIPLSWVIWRLFQLFIVDTKEMVYQFSSFGLVFGATFCVFVIVCIFILGVKFIKRTNIIDIVQEGRKSESVRDVAPWYGIVGWVFFFLGILLGYLVPQIVFDCFEYNLPTIWSFTYVFSLVGIYMIMLYAVVHSKKGKNPNKYYKNIISHNMMRFCGKQTVKNMCVIALLISGALFAAFYTPTTMSSAFEELEEREIKNAFFYRFDQNQITNDEIYSLAKQHKMVITDFHNAETFSLISDGYFSDYSDNKIVTTYHEKFQLADFISESDFNAVTGLNVSVENGKYLQVVTDEADEAYYAEKGISVLTHPETKEEKSIKFSGVVLFRSLIFNHSQSLSILSDIDYALLSKGIEPRLRHRFVLFNLANESASYPFLKELKNEIVLRSNSNVAIPPSYDLYKKEVADQAGEAYYSDEYLGFEFTPDNTQLFLQWKYYPHFTEIDRQDLVKNIAVFLMLFIYIAIICMVAVSVIAYTRGVTIGIDNHRMFNDLKRLGANKKYIRRSIKKQLSRIFIFPTLVGCIACWSFNTLIMFGNDNYINQGEWIGILINSLIAIAVSFVMYGIYLVTKKKVFLLAEN